MRNGIMAAVAAVGILAAGCAANKAQQAELTDTRVAALEAQVAALQQRLDEVQRQQPAYSGPASSAERIVSRSAGKRHLSVREVQRALTAAGTYQGVIDGKQGPQTQRAIKSFQEANGLKADGVVGPATTEALAKYLEEYGMSHE